MAPNEVTLARFYKLFPSHKSAVKTLYRTFLRHAIRLPLDDEWRGRVVHEVRRSFKHKIGFRGAEILRKELIAAYENEKVFRRAAEDTSPPESNENLSTIINSLKRIYERRAEIKAQKQLSDDLAATLPESVQIAPLPARRKRGRPVPYPYHDLPPVPKITDIQGTGVAFLKWPGNYKSSGGERLQSMLREKMAKRVALLDAVLDTNGDVHANEVIAEGEDLWDEELQLEHDIELEDLIDSPQLYRQSFWKWKDHNKEELNRYSKQQSEIVAKFEKIREEALAVRDKEEERRRRLAEEVGLDKAIEIVAAEVKKERKQKYLENRIRRKQEEEDRRVRKEEKERAKYAAITAERVRKIEEMERLTSSKT